MPRGRPKRSNLGMQIFFGVFFAVLLIGGAVFVAMQTQLFSLTGNDNDSEIPVSCDSTTTPSVTFNAFDDENKGTAIVESMIYRKKGSVAWTATNTGTAITDMEIGETYEYILGITTSDFIDNAYGPAQEYVVPCKETDSVDLAMNNDEIETSLTATFYNADDNAAAETFVAGQAQEIELKFQAGSDEVFGNPFLPSDMPNVLCLNLNKTAWDSPDYVKYNGQDLAKVGTPIRHSVDSTDTAYCYEAPVISEDETRIQIKLKADDANAPVADDVAYLYAGNWFINDDGEAG